MQCDDYNGFFLIVAFSLASGIFPYKYKNGIIYTYLE